MSRLADRSPGQFAEWLSSRGLRRAYLVFDPRTRAHRASDPALEGLAEVLAGIGGGGSDHEAVFLEVGRESGALFGAFLHKTLRGQGQGGVRHGCYRRLGDFLRDGLRLSRSMTRKNALAGLWWGGGKGVIAQPAGGAARDPAARRLLFREFGSFVSSLRGCYVTAEDAGTMPADMVEVFRGTRFATCVPGAVGGSGDPSPMTAAGVVCAIEAALDFLGMGSLVGKKVAVQGTGNVGSAILRLLLERGVERVVASEISAERRVAALDALAGDRVEIRLVGADERGILEERCDVLVPCALGGVLGPETIPSLRASIVCGATNDPLVDDRRDDRALAERGVTFVPDFVSNRMGIVTCANEQYGSVSGDPEIWRHLDRGWPGGIYRTTLRVLELARDTGVTPSAAANRLADELADRPHPIWGDRARRIIGSLVSDRWHQSGPPTS